MYDYYQRFHASVVITAVLNHQVVSHVLSSHEVPLAVASSPQDRKEALGSRNGNL